MKFTQACRISRVNSQRGVGLIEVLVSIFILAIGGLGVAMFQLNAVKFNRSAMIHSQATILAYQIVDSMRANKIAAKAGAYTVAIGFTKPSGTCGTITVANCDLQTWYTALSQTLPAGTGAISFSGSVATITVQWDESRLQNLSQSVYAQSPAQVLTTFQFQTQLW